MSKLFHMIYFIYNSKELLLPLANLDVLHPTKLTIFSSVLMYCNTLISKINDRIWSPSILLLFTVFTATSAPFTFPKNTAPKHPDPSWVFISKIQSMLNILFKEYNYFHFKIRYSINNQLPRSLYRH